MTNNTTKTPHQSLVSDLSKLLTEATNFHFHDFKSRSDSPKQDLVQNLKLIALKTVNGMYDDKADAEDLALLKQEAMKVGIPEGLMKAIFGAENV